MTQQNIGLRGPVDPTQRHSRKHPCPACDGYEAQRRGKGVRCTGFVSTDGHRFVCTRDEFAGNITFDEKVFGYWHRIKGTCGCGEDHDAGAAGSTSRVPSSPSPGPLEPRIITTTEWPLKLADGSVAIHKRVDYDDGDKRYEWSRDGTLGLKGYGIENLPLYGIDKVPAGAIRVIVGEGEKAADALTAASFAAVGTVTGGKSTPSDAALQALVGHDVYLWPDNDEVGIAHMQRIAERLDRLGVSVHVVTWANAPEGGDAADLLATGTTQDVDALITTAVPFTSTRPRFMTLREFVGHVPAEPDWVLARYVAIGMITMLLGPAKLSGKTTLTLAGVRAVLEGTDFLGWPTKPGRVVYMTEEGPATFAPAVAQAGLDLDSPGLSVLGHDAVRSMSWPDVIAMAHDEVIRAGARLLVIDTLADWTRPEGASENDSGRALQDMQPLLALRQLGVGILLLHHPSKNATTVEGARGSTAYAASVDALALMRRDFRKPANVRIVDAVGRSSHIPASMAIALTAHGYVRADEGDFEAQRTDALWDHLPLKAETAVTVAELEDSTGLKSTAIRKRLGVMVTRRRVEVRGKGTKGDPKRYSRRDDYAASIETEAAVSIEKNGE